MLVKVLSYTMERLQDLLLIVEQFFCFMPTNSDLVSKLIHSQDKFNSEVEFNERSRSFLKKMIEEERTKMLCNCALLGRK